MQFHADQPEISWVLLHLRRGSQARQANTSAVEWLLLLFSRLSYLVDGSSDEHHLKALPFLGQEVRAWIGKLAMAFRERDYV